MSELPAVSGREAIKALQIVGFEVARIEGSHHILKKPGHPFNLSVPVRASKSLKRGTLRRLIRDAGLTVEEFIEALER
ncbi:MAG: type II toxin-antitoxin system HicA family toxin [Phycisphaerales bacterium]|nr:MAG: type II toxin-antitoxin system HicA family toxin [Phycisphaerales bacterium]